MKIRHAIPPSLLVLLLAASPAIADPSPDPVTAAMEQGKDMKKDMSMHMQHAKGMNMHAAADMKWGDAPPTLPKGAKVAVLVGDPGKAGPFVIRLKMPPGYKVPPHWHSKAENVTVISGALSLGMGDTLDMKAAQTLKMGGFHSIGAQIHHYAFSKSGAVVQIHGEGPFDITYINPADNPDPAAKK